MKFLKPLVILGLVLLALVVVAEILVRVLFPAPLEPPGGLLMTNEIPGIKPSANFDYDGERLRTPGWSEDSGALRVLAVGGQSTTALLQSSADAWWGQLAEMLSASGGAKVEITALAETGGGKILPGVAAAEKILENHKVDLVIAMFGFMDLMGTPGDAKFAPAALDRLRELEPVGPKYQLAKLSHLVRLMRNSKTARLQRAKQRDLAQPNYYRDFLHARGRYLAGRPVLEGFERTGDDPLKNYLLGIEALAAAAKERGAKLLVVGEPTIYKSSLGQAESSRLTVPWFPTSPKDKGDTVSSFRVRPLAVETELQRFYNAAAARCEQLGVGWVNLQGEVPRFADYFITESYLSDRGAQAAAKKLVAPVAVQLGIAGATSGASQ